MAGDDPCCFCPVDRLSQADFPVSFLPGVFNFIAGKITFRPDQNDPSLIPVGLVINVAIQGSMAMCDQLDICG